MNLHEYQIMFVVVTGVLMLLAASPALSRLLVYPRTEFFTELWLLGPNHAAEDYPFNVSRGQSYSVYLGLGNHLGYCAYYLVEVKFRNETQPAPTSFGPIENMTPSNLSSLFNITAFVADESVWERGLTFGLDYGFDETLSSVEFNSLALDGVTVRLDGLSTMWNASTSRFYGDLIFELWLYNSTVNDFVYHERFVDLKLNMTLV